MLFSSQVATLHANSLHFKECFGPCLDLLRSEHPGIDSCLHNLGLLDSRKEDVSKADPPPADFTGLLILTERYTGVYIIYFDIFSQSLTLLRKFF